MVTTKWIKRGALYYRSDIAKRWSLTVEQVTELQRQGVIKPVPLGSAARPVFLGQELLDAVERRLQPQDKEIEDGAR